MFAHGRGRQSQWQKDIWTIFYLSSVTSTQKKQIRRSDNVEIYSFQSCQQTIS